jgi:hypothetical protein
VFLQCKGFPSIIYVCERNDSGEGARGRFAHRTTNAGCSPSAISATTRESGPSGARELGSVSQPPFGVTLHEKRGETLGRFVRNALDALIWACCASGKVGMRMEDIVRVFASDLRTLSTVRASGLMGKWMMRHPGRSSPSEFVARGFCKVWRRQLGRSLRVKHSARSQLHTPISDLHKKSSDRKNATSRETWWRAIYLAEKCVSRRFHLNPNRWS